MEIMHELLIICISVQKIFQIIQLRGSGILFAEKHLFLLVFFFIFH